MLQKYIHLERFGTDEVDAINIGECHIFPKLDGTNASFWDEGDGGFRCGSRNRELSPDDDNAGFMAWAVQQENLRTLAERYPGCRFYGEWLVPHSLKTYREDAWRKFYLFDVLKPDGEFMHYDQYSELAKAHGVEFIPCMLKVKNPTYDVLQQATEKNTFLLKENAGHGEGVVIKQYGYKNRFGRTTWAKLITNTFRDEHVKEMGGAVMDLRLLEETIADEFITLHMVEKIIAKIRNEKGAFVARDIPQLLGMAYHDLVVEELWQAIKRHKNPKIDFKTLNTCAIKRVKALRPDLFGLPALAA